MKSDCVRTSLDLPKELLRRLHEAAVRSGTSTRQFFLNSLERALDEQSPERLSLEIPIVTSRGQPFDFSHEELYDLIDFP